MSVQPKRRRVEAGVFERVNATGSRLGLEITFKDAEGKTRRRTVTGGIEAARDALAASRVKRVRTEREPVDPRVTFDAIADAFEAAHVSGLRPNSRDAYGLALTRLRSAFGAKRISTITKLDLRAYVAAEKSEGLRANSILAHLNCLSALYSFARDDLDLAVAMPRLKPSERPQADDAREHRVLSDHELGLVLEACSEQTRLYFRDSS